MRWMQKRVDVWETIWAWLRNSGDGVGEVGRNRGTGALCSGFLIYVLCLDMA